MKTHRLFRRSAWLIRIVVGVSVAAATVAPAASGGDLNGVWLVANLEARVELRACGDALCGGIVWLREPHDEHGRERTDGNNPDKALRDRTILGLEILQGLRPSRDTEDLWVGGTIYDPKSGRTYRCKMRRDGADQLKLRGFWGISLLGKTTHWTRVAAANVAGR